MLEKEIHHGNRCMLDYFKYSKERWDKSHKPPELRIVDLVFASTFNFNNIKQPNKMKASFAGPFVIKDLHGLNAVQLEITGEVMKKDPAFPLILRKPYSQIYKELFLLINKPPLKIPPLEEGEENQILQVLKERTPTQAD
ncbi:hypothetical protein O181_028267 [Austropuccinia psidii MF-1]|uniref:Uncharacterized protein n=1 Tax=Austropuccinia psidii MF-1 TaxID=1389203 RepID=A0A9Q3CU85_9BASI|nr:hypothetical protein [Austropuccinia psidii MF-1]